MPRLEPLRPEAMSAAQRQVYNALLSDKRGERPSLDDASEATAYAAASELYRMQRLSSATYARAIQ
jgi:hypothetical protein